MRHQYTINIFLIKKSSDFKKSITGFNLVIISFILSRAGDSALPISSEYLYSNVKLTMRCLKDQIYQII